MDYRRTHKLVIKQILLGRDAKEDEFNVVEVSTNSEYGTAKLPIAVLKVGDTRAVRPDLEFPAYSTTFKLIEGSGPVYLHGSHILMAIENEGEFTDDEQAEEDTDEEDGAASRPKMAKTAGRFPVRPKVAENNGKAKKK